MPETCRRLTPGKRWLVGALSALALGGMFLATGQCLALLMMGMTATGILDLLMLMGFSTAVAMCIGLVVQGRWLVIGVYTALIGAVVVYTLAMGRGLPWPALGVSGLIGGGLVILRRRGELR